MTRIGKRATLTVAAFCLSVSASALSASGPLPIHVTCDGPTHAPLCTALALILEDTQPRDVVVMYTPAPQGAAVLTVHYTALQSDADAMAGHLTWMDRQGHAGQGPTIALSVQDAPINKTLLATYAGELLRFSALPL